MLRREGGAISVRLEVAGLCGEQASLWVLSICLSVFHPGAFVLGLPDALRVRLWMIYLVQMK
jgi:hypothetical protein